MSPYLSDVGHDSELHGRIHARSRRARRRRRLRRSRIILLIAGALLVLLGLLLLCVAHFKQGPERVIVIRMATLYMWSAAACLLLHVGVTHRLYRKRDSVTAGRPGTRRHAPRRAKRQGGAVLILALVVVALISGLVLRIQSGARSDLSRESAVTRHARLRLAATDAALEALSQLANDEDLSVDHLDEPWAVAREYRTPAGIFCTVRVRDEQGYFNLNDLAVASPDGRRAAEGVLLDIMVACGVMRPLEKVEALRDWVDEDARGAGERSGDAGGARPYAPANRPLATWSELLTVRHYDRGIFERRSRAPLEDPLGGNLLDAVTILPPTATGVTPINLNTVGRDALRGILGIEYSAVVERVLRERAARPLRDIDALSLSPDILSSVGTFLGIRSSYFSVTATAEDDDHEAEVRALVLRDGQGRVELLQWVSDTLSF